MKYHAALSIAFVASALAERFRNPRIRHLLAQIAADGSQKVPIRVAPGPGGWPTVPASPWSPMCPARLPCLPLLLPDAEHRPDHQHQQNDDVLATHGLTCLLRASPMLTPMRMIKSGIAPMLTTLVQN